VEMSGRDSGLAQARDRRQNKIKLGDAVYP